MATATRITRFKDGRFIRRFIARGGSVEMGTVAMDSSYVTGGETLTAPFRMGTIKGAFISPRSGYVFEYDVANAKVIAYRGGTADTVLNQVASGTDLSALSDIPYFVWGYD